MIMTMIVKLKGAVPPATLPGGFCPLIPVLEDKESTTYIQHERVGQTWHWVLLHVGCMLYLAVNMWSFPGCGLGGCSLPQVVHKGHNPQHMTIYQTIICILIIFYLAIFLVSFRPFQAIGVKISFFWMVLGGVPWQMSYILYRCQRVKEIHRHHYLSIWSCKGILNIYPFTDIFL